MSAEEQLASVTITEITGYLQSHPESTALQIANAVGTADHRYIFLLLELSESAGKVVRSRKGISQPWRWKVNA